MRKGLIIAVVVTIALMFGWLVMSQLPGRGFDTNLSRLGQGQPALVLAFENYSPAGMNAMELLEQVREEYEGRMLFLVADQGTPQGRGFAQRHGIRDGMAILVSGNGRAVSQYPISGDADVLRRQLDADLRER